VLLLLFKRQLIPCCSKKEQKTTLKNIFPPSVNFSNEADNQKMLEEKHSNRKKEHFVISMRYVHCDNCSKILLQKNRNKKIPFHEKNQ
jgi:hypothetical protein